MKRKILILLIGFIPSLILGCSPKLEPPLPTPDRACPVLASWESIVPGQSTQRDVLKILHKPDYTEFVNDDEGRFVSYAYWLKSKEAASLKLRNRIIFNQNNVVKWMEIIVSPPGEMPKNVRFFSDQYGGRVDTIYRNNNYRSVPAGKFMDVLETSDTIYVWSNCGVALSVLNDLDVDLKPGTAQDGYEVMYPSHGSPEHPNAYGYVYLQFLFPSTTYQEFEQNFRYKIPFYDWDFWDKFRNTTKLQK